MPTFAGWYMSHDDCRAWLEVNNRTLLEKHPGAGAGALRLSIGRVMNHAGFLERFELRYICPPGFKGPPRKGPGLSPMLVRRSSEQKVYIPPKPDPNGYDVIGQTILKEMYGLDSPVWSVLWWDSEDPTIASELCPEDEQSSL
ncbi:hypothetical protein FRC07_014032 [Ceratobasidium sp. 392]|nr:hypothetical protein FRC07_014032 [Ceratobasidium sp. 392]